MILLLGWGCHASERIESMLPRMAASVRFSRKWLCPSWTSWSCLRCFSRSRCLQSGRVRRDPSFQRAEWQNGIFILSQTTTGSPPSGIFELPDGNAGFSLRRQRNQKSSRLSKAVQEGRIQNSFPKQRTNEQNLHLHLFPLFCKHVLSVLLFRGTGRMAHANIKARAGLNQENF